jgi:hypothetical protein
MEALGGRPYLPTQWCRDTTSPVHLAAYFQSLAPTTRRRSAYALIDERDQRAPELTKPSGRSSVNMPHRICSGFLAWQRAPTAIRVDTAVREYIQNGRITRMTVDTQNAPGRARYPVGPRIAAPTVRICSPICGNTGRSYEAMRLRTYAAVSLHAYVESQLCGYIRTQLHMLVEGRVTNSVPGLTDSGCHSRCRKQQGPGPHI